MLQGVERRPIADVTPHVWADKVVSRRQPVVLTGCTFGTAVADWIPENLSRACGERLVSAHVCEKGNMDFLLRNFKFEVMPFAQFLERAFHSPDDTHKYYLRSMGVNMRKDPSDIRRGFPEIAPAFALPSCLPQETLGDWFHSSCLRVSGPATRLWTHYDIMDNVLCSIRGRKRVVFWPPSEADNLYIEGSSSPVIDIDNPDLVRFPKFARARSVTVDLEEGDMLFIPALWFHNVIAIDPCIAVNVFWRHLPRPCYEAKDIYGNKDLVAGQSALNHATALRSDLAALPPYYRRFYLQRIITQLAVDL